jgi:formyltetrahydrofolate deformylase
MPFHTFVALLHGPDRPGIVSDIAGYIRVNGGNILHADQHRDDDEGVFFQRLEWSVANDGAQSHKSAFREFAASIGMSVHVVDKAERPRVVVMVSKQEHAFHDLMLRWRSGELPCDIVRVISNHDDSARDAAHYGVEFVKIPVNAANKAQAEQVLLDMVHEVRADVVVLARYMQVLSDDFLRKLGKPVINIHHSFLPAFVGAKPYHQAHARGVKLIGATAHYVTAELDNGPIIEQDVARVSHRHSVNDMVRMGQDLEKIVLSRAVRRHLEHRVLAYANKTVVFE